MVFCIQVFNQILQQGNGMGRDTAQVQPTSKIGVFSLRRCGKDKLEPIYGVNVHRLCLEMQFKA